MSLARRIVSHGNGNDHPKRGDEITIGFLGFIFDGSTHDGRGRQISCMGYTMKFGNGEFIKGIEQGVLQMTLGETAVLTISPFVFVIFLGVPLAALFAALANEARYVLREHVLTNRQWFSDLAYGESGLRNFYDLKKWIVEPNSTLLFEIKLTAINGKQAERANEEGGA